MTDQTSLDARGAAWLVAHRPAVQIIGIDYLTAATYADLTASHETLLGKVLFRLRGAVSELHAGV